MIKEATLSEIRNIKLDYNARIPVLEEYLALCKNYQKHAFIELKDVFDDFKIKLIYEKTQQYLELNQITFISFHLDNLKKMRLLNPHLKIQYILGHHEQEKIDLAVQYGFDMNIHHHSLFNDLIDFIHDHHLKVNCWTVNSKNDAEKYIEMGIDFITTDGF